MKRFGKMVRKLCGYREVTIPESRLTEIRQTLKRRLDDEVLTLFERACAGNDLDSAADLLTVLENRHARRVANCGHERRVCDNAVQQARRDLARVQALHDASRRAQVVRSPAGALVFSSRDGLLEAAR